MILVTGATGNLGQLAVKELSKKLPPTKIAVLARSADKAAPLAAQGISVRLGDYEDQASLDAAFAGISRVLFISSSEVGARARQHARVIEAARKAAVELVAYTSILHADRSSLALAAEHLATERALEASGLPFVLLRNGWYLENYTEHLAGTLANGAILGAAGEGRIAAAARADFAAAAAEVVTREGQAGKIYELAGDEPFTLAELAAEVSKQSGKSIASVNLSPADYEAKLVSFGVPAGFAHVLADSDAGAEKGDLDDRSGDLKKLIGRPTTTLADAIRAGLAALNQG